MYIHAGGVIIVEVNWLLKSDYSSHCCQPRVVSLNLILFKFSHSCVSLTLPPRKSGKNETKQNKNSSEHFFSLQRRCLTHFVLALLCLQLYSLLFFPHNKSLVPPGGLKGCFQTMEGASGTGGGSWFACVGGEVYATVNGVVVLVGGGGLTGQVLPGLVVDVGVIYEGDVGCGVFYSKLRMGHEIVNGGSGFWFFQAFIERATKCIHNTDLYGWKKKIKRQKNSISH